MREARHLSYSPTYIYICIHMYIYIYKFVFTCKHESLKADQPLPFSSSEAILHVNKLILYSSSLLVRLQSSQHPRSRSRTQAEDIARLSACTVEGLRQERKGAADGSVADISSVDLQTHEAVYDVLLYTPRTQTL